jgi:4-hydroxy-tetrahydrodipicolinate reductase
VEVDKVKIALVGLGRTGKIAAEYLFQQGVLSMVLCRPNSMNAHKDLGDILHIKDTGIMIDTSDHLERKLFQTKPDVLIDFSCTSFLTDNIHILEKCGINVVTAVTGYESAELEKIRNVAQKGNIGVVVAPNITYGVNVLMLMVEIAAELMNDYDFEIYEEHHKHKKDSPSGTAKKIAEQIRRSLVVHETIPTHAVRAGGIVGKHKVMICGEFDQIEISHQAYSRKAFAEGAYKVAQFVTGKTGFYEMSDVFEHEKRKREQLIAARQEDENTRVLNLA